MDKIKPCPCCGSEAKLFNHYTTGDSHVKWAVSCQSCGVMVSYCDDLMEAIAQWDRRTPDVSTLITERNTLRELLREFRKLTEGENEREIRELNNRADAVLAPQVMTEEEQLSEAIDGRR